MATTQNTYTGDNSTTLFSFTFPYLEESDVKVSLDGVDQLTTAYSFANATTISFNTAPANGVAIRIYRVTATDSAQATFFAGSAIRAQDLNDNNLQILYATQETVNRRIDSTGGTMSGDLNMGGNKITNVASPTGGTDVVTKAYLDTFSFNPAGTGNVGFTGNITVAGNITGAGTLGVTGAATFGSTATFGGDVTITSTGALTIPDGTNAERPTAVTGMIRFNTDITQFEGYNGSSWSSIGGGATGGGADTVFFENSQTVTTDYTLTTNKNAVTAGPITINSGVTVTVPSGQSWVIV
jgi:hypothetical protein